MQHVLVVGLGGFVGAVARYGLTSLVHRHYPGVFPVGTLLVNVLGCFAIGAVLSLVEDRQCLSPSARLFLTVGVLGSMTTFSTLGYETVQLLRYGALRLALASVVANLVVGVAAVVAGRAAVRALSG